MTSVLLPSSAHGATHPLFGDRIQLTNQHVDLRVVLQPEPGTGLTLTVDNDDAQVRYHPTNVVLVVKEEARREIPPGFDLLGPAGSSLWILPQSQDPRLLYLGFSVASPLDATFLSPVSIHLTHVEGPGSLLVWQAAGFGQLDLILDSRDGLDERDVFRPLIGGHDHLNWGFTAPGWYEVTLRIDGTPSAGPPAIEGEEITLLFAVEPLPEPPVIPPTLRLVTGTSPGTVRLTVEDLAVQQAYVLQASTNAGTTWEDDVSWVATETVQEWILTPAERVQWWRVILGP